MSKNVNNLSERDCFHRAAQFKEAYGLNVKIQGMSYNDENWDWDMVILKFVDSLGKHYGLIEYFKPGKDNSTDHVDFEWVEHERFVKKTYERFIDAELAMVELMKKRLAGEDT